MLCRRGNPFVRRSHGSAEGPRYLRWTVLHEPNACIRGEVARERHGWLYVWNADARLRNPRMSPVIVLKISRGISTKSSSFQYRRALCALESAKTIRAPWTGTCLLFYNWVMGHDASTGFSGGKCVPGMNMDGEVEVSRICLPRSSQLRQ